jgi:hypothetical protein
MKSSAEIISNCWKKITAKEFENKIVDNLFGNFL